MNDLTTNDWLILVNAQHPLSPDFIPGDLIPAPFSGKEWMNAAAAEQLQRLIHAIFGEREIVVTSAYRSYEEQQRLYRHSLKSHGEHYTKLYVAEPGRSEHQTGLAVDLGFADYANDVICPTFEGRAVSLHFMERMAEFGFILRYPKGKTAVTGIAHEPWHFRYVGCPHSQLIQQQRWTLEEYHRFINRGREAND